MQSHILLLLFNCQQTRTYKTNYSPSITTIPHYDLSITKSTVYLSGKTLANMAKVPGSSPSTQKIKQAIFLKINTAEIHIRIQIKYIKIIFLTKDSSSSIIVINIIFHL